MQKTKTLLSIAIIAVLPFTANAENISGNMYTAPAHYDSNHPAPTTNAEPSYGRVNIDTDDQGHIATTAYVKGAYNSAIAAVNRVNDLLSHDIGLKQNRLTSTGDGGDIEPDVFDYNAYYQAVDDMLNNGDADNFLVSVDALHGAIEVAKYEVKDELQEKIMVPHTVPNGNEHEIDNYAAGIDEIMTAVMGSGDPRDAGPYRLATGEAVAYGILSRASRVYTTWGNDSATVTVPLVARDDITSLPYTRIGGNN